MVEPLNDIIAKMVDYRSYWLMSKGACHDYSVASKIYPLRKQLDVQLKSRACSGQYPIAELNFLARFKTACSHKGVSEGVAVWCFKFYLTGQTHAVLQLDYLHLSWPSMRGSTECWKPNRK